MNNLSCILNNAWPLFQETKEISWRNAKESDLLNVCVFFDNEHKQQRMQKRRKGNQDNVSIHQHLYRWTGQAECPTDSRWTGLVVVELKAHNKGSLCAFSGCRWELSGNSGWERREWRMKPCTCNKGWGWGPLVLWPPTCGCVYVNMCKRSFMCVSCMNKDNVDNEIACSVTNKEPLHRTKAR